MPNLHETNKPEKGSEARQKHRPKTMKTHLITVILFLGSFFCIVAQETSQSAGEQSTGKTFSRPEERGEDFSKIPAPGAISKLSQSKNQIERRKLAKVLGDRSMAGSLPLSEADKAQLGQEVTNLLQQAKSPEASERVEAAQQIERLWHLAVPTLVSNITTNDATVAELAIKSLILMRDESIVKQLIQEAKTATDAGRKQLLVFALSKMKEQRESLIPGRKCLGEKESEELYGKLVLPALTELLPRQQDGLHCFVRKSMFSMVFRTRLYSILLSPCRCKTASVNCLSSIRLHPFWGEA